MRVGDRELRTIGSDHDAGTIAIIDQTLLPGRLEIRELTTLAQTAEAIAAMRVRGAPLIGVTAAFGLWLALREDPADAGLEHAIATLAGTRPTAVNLVAALRRVRDAVAPLAPARRARAAHDLATAMADEDVAANRAIGEHGARLLRERWQAEGRPTPLTVMTHCNAGWLATVDRGTALAPIYELASAGVPLHVIVSETRPRNQGELTAWELEQAGVDCTFVADSACGHLLQRGGVHAVIVGCDRLTARGDVCNKIGTYLKALAADAAGVLFVAAVPSTTIDWSLVDGDAIPIEERAAAEVSTRFAAANPAFDVTPARLVSAIVTERGTCPADAAALRALHAGPAGGSVAVGSER